MIVVFQGAFPCTSFFPSGCMALKMQRINKADIIIEEGYPRNDFLNNYMNEDVYYCLFHEMFENQWWVLIHDRRILGMKILFDNNIRGFTLK